jgi:hypothetical protein
MTPPNHGARFTSREHLDHGHVELPGQCVADTQMRWVGLAKASLVEQYCRRLDPQIQPSKAGISGQHWWR